MKTSIHKTRAINTLKDMEAQFAKLKNAASFREYLGAELIINIFKERYEKWLK